MLFIFVCVVAVYSNYVSATIDNYDCTGDEFQCGLSGECIPNLWVCDRVADCPGREDEIRCCGSDRFNCMSGRCINFEEVCDGNWDCNQGDDERDCEVNPCSEDEFICSISGRCIPKKWECDFFNDCPDREDELDCCPDDRFACNNGKCISSSLMCDGFNNCEDGEDELEENCDDYDMCATDANNCHEHATCINVPDSFICECYEGFYGDGLSCADIDECSDHIDDCDADAICTNTQGGYTCDCNMGYSGNGTHCLDIEECVENSHSCRHFSTCTNTQGSYTCGCDTGYRGDGVSCTDIDECEEGLDNCHHNATCENQFGYYLCECNRGYQGDGTTCSDLDECAENMHNCDALGTCVNTEGSYECECHDGLELGDDGFSCQDIDECDTYTHNCHVFGICTNRFGLYECECEDGFTGNGFECSDVNECDDYFVDCSPFASCINMIGSYECKCNNGYTGDGTTCERQSIRLVGGNSKFDHLVGRVEIFIGSKWSPICDNSWDDLDAEVVCRQLGLPHGFPMGVRGSHFGPGEGKPVMDYVACAGIETDVRDCEHESINIMCESNEQAGVICTDHSNIRLADSIESSFNVKGRVQIMKNGIWGNVCHNSWDNFDAKVTCRQLGLPYELARSYSTPVSAAQTSEWFAIDNVGCDGDEHDLTKCLHTSRVQRNCEFAAVICSDGLQIDMKTDLFDTDICGTRAGIGGRIAGGQDASISKWPWAGILLIEVPEGDTYRCAASLINNDWAVTAAHCMVSGYQKLTLIFGDSSLYRNGQSEHLVERTASAICHPGYNQDLGYIFNNDICLLKLDVNVTYNKFVRPVCLSESQEEQTAYGSCYVLGWGWIREGGPPSSTLQELATNVISNAECNQIITDHVSNNMICTLTGSAMSSCPGDGGGPLVCQSGPNKWHLVGISSFGYGCGYDVYPDVLTRVSHYTRWIYKAIAEYGSE